MAVRKQTQRQCKLGHSYYKSSDCPVCPVCAQLEKSRGDFLSLLSAPAGRALRGAGIQSLSQLSTFSEKELLQLHGFGPASLPILQRELKKAGLGFKRTS